MIGQLDRVVQLNALNTEKNKFNCQNLISVFSGKGGTGKTFVSLNLAFTLSKKKKKILLVDLDTNLSNIHLMLNAKVDGSLFNYFTNKNTLDEIVTHYNDFLDIIFGESGRSEFPDLNKSIMHFFLSDIEKFSRQYDFLILDLGAGASKEILYLASNSAVKILVSNPEPTAIIDSYVMVKLLENQNFKSEVKILMNKCISEEEGLSAYSKLKTAVDHFLQSRISLSVIMLNDEEVHRSIIEQKLYLKSSTDPKLSNAFDQLSNELIKYDHVTNINQSIDHSFRSAL